MIMPRLRRIWVLLLAIAPLAVPSYLLAALPLAVVMFLAFEQIDKILPAI